MQPIAVTEYVAGLGEGELTGASQASHESVRESVGRKAEQQQAAQAPNVRRQQPEQLVGEANQIEDRRPVGGVERLAPPRPRPRSRPPLQRDGRARQQQPVRQGRRRQRHRPRRRPRRHVVEPVELQQPLGSLPRAPVRPGGAHAQRARTDRQAGGDRLRLLERVRMRVARHRGVLQFRTGGDSAGVSCMSVQYRTRCVRPTYDFIDDCSRGFL